MLILIYTVNFVSAVLFLTGFARVAIYDLSSISSGQHSDTIIDKATRLDR